jgi:hypothetical protein
MTILRPCSWPVHLPRSSFLGQAEHRESAVIKQLFVCKRQSNKEDPDGLAASAAFANFVSAFQSFVASFSSFTDDVETLKKLESTIIHDGFARRFLDPMQCSSISVDLHRPDISNGEENDIDRIGNALAKLGKKFGALNIPADDAERKKAIRRTLAKVARETSVTWPMLWRFMLTDAPAAPEESA